jgi:uncharacterized membrane protein YkvA (DUF1232 family)
MHLMRLAWRLLRDPQVPVWTKLIPLGAIAYIVLPADFIPDAIPILGQTDDLGILLLSLKLFIDLCPPGIVERHLAQMSSVQAEYRVVQEDNAPQATDAAGYLEESPRVPAEETPSRSTETEGK